MSDPTGEILAAMESAAQFCNAHNLHVGQIEFTSAIAGANSWDLDVADWRPSPTNVSVLMYWRPAEMLAWFEALDAPVVLVTRREHDTLFRTRATRGGLGWSVGGGLIREHGTERLPGITVEWERLPSGKAGSHGKISVAELRTAMESLGVVPVKVAS